MRLRGTCRYTSVYLFGRYTGSIPLGQQFSFQAPREDGRPGGSTDDNFGPGTGQGLFYA
jgi:hypothetical protein